MLELRRDMVAGSYFGMQPGSALILRVDVGRDDSIDIISGDVFEQTGPQSFRISHSFRSTTLVLGDRDDSQLLRCPVKIFGPDMPGDARLDLSIPDSGELVATYTPLGNTSYQLSKESELFRQVEIQVDQVQDVPLPEPFDTQSHSDTSATFPPQDLTFESTFRNAGIDLDVQLGNPNLPLTLAGSDGLWTKDELHDAMTEHFSGHADARQWQLYLLLATRYKSPGTLGIMFDGTGDFPRQGCAVFYDHPALSGATGPTQKREYLYTIVHEIGHTFNLLHAFQKGFFHSNGVLPRPASLSWMNYPFLYPFGYAGDADWDGTNDFWTKFPFVFDHQELAHLRHNDLREVVMGGRSFGFAGHLEEREFDRHTQDTEVAQDTDVSLTLWLPEIVDFLEQVEGDVRLRNEGLETVAVNPNIEPTAGGIELLVRRPCDRFPKVYRTFYRGCVKEDLVNLAPGEAIYQEISPAFARRSWLIDEPGTYEAQAVGWLPDGRKLISNIVRLRVRVPTREEETIANDFFTYGTGAYFGLDGSRTDSLESTRQFLDEVSDRLPEGGIARQIATTNALRDTRVFKSVRNAEIILPDDRGDRARDLLSALGADVDQRAVTISESQGHLRLRRMLGAAVDSLAAVEDTTGASNVLSTMQGLLQAVSAPDQAYGELESFRTGVELDRGVSLQL